MHILNIVVKLLNIIPVLAEASTHSASNPVIGQTMVDADGSPPGANKTRDFDGYSPTVLQTIMRGRGALQTLSSRGRPLRPQPGGTRDPRSKDTRVGTLVSVSEVFPSSTASNHDVEVSPTPLPSAPPLLHPDPGSTSSPRAEPQDYTPKGSPGNRSEMDSPGTVRSMELQSPSPRRDHFNMMAESTPSPVNNRTLIPDTTPRTRTSSMVSGATPTPPAHRSVHLGLVSSPDTDGWVVPETPSFVLDKTVGLEKGTHRLTLNTRPFLKALLVPMATFCRPHHP